MLTMLRILRILRNAENTENADCDPLTTSPTDANYVGCGTESRIFLSYLLSVLYPGDGI